MDYERCCDCDFERKLVIRKRSDVFIVGQGTEMCGGAVWSSDVVTMIWSCEDEFDGRRFSKRLLWRFGDGNMRNYLFRDDY